MFAKFLFAAVPLLSGESDHFALMVHSLIPAVMAIDGCTREATILPGDTCDAICKFAFVVLQHRL
jgi:hypothetical protein